MEVNRFQIHQNKLFRLPKVCFMSIRCLQDSAPGFVADKTFQCWKSFLPDTLTSVLGLKDSHAQSSRAMPLRVLLQSRLGWPFEAMKDLDASSEKSCRSSLQTKGGTRLCSPFTLVTSWCSQRRSSPSALMVHMSSPKGYEIKLYRPGKVFSPGSPN